MINLKSNTNNLKSRFLFLFTISLFSTYVSIAQIVGEDCNNPIIINTIPYVAIGNTTNATDDYFASCPDYGNQGGANDIVYKFSTGTNDLYVDISLCKNITNYDCQLYVFENSCVGSPVGC